MQRLCQQGYTQSCVSVCFMAAVCIFVCVRERYPVLSVRGDVNRSCGLCWTLIQHVVFFFFSSCFMFRPSAMESMIMVTFTPVIFSVHIFPTPPFLPLLSSKCPLLFHPPLYSPLCCFCSPSLCPFLSFCFFPLPAPLALPPGRGGTVMFMKPFNVLCNYPGNTSHHYSGQ